MLKLLNKLFNNKPKFLVDPKDPYSLRFTLAGENYYSFDDPMKTPGLRGLHCILAFDELRMRTRRELLEKETEFTLRKTAELKLALSGNGGRISLGHAFGLISEIEEVNVFRKERLNFIFEPDLAYKFASVVFFDENENPYTYDQAYCEKKIEKWKQHEEIGAFFLRQPIAQLIPFLGNSEVDIPTYSKVVRKIVSRHSERVSSRKYKRASMTGTGVKS